MPINAIAGAARPCLCGGPAGQYGSNGGEKRLTVGIARRGFPVWSQSVIG
ncbi:hypothetical protein ZHAS_00017207 [Anopheles sinensis]|uniref:Uncharacterized protein n=1 Tax=Anopheles sinensis TaxID=74873 RepID=A0A084WG61_ANOSI|nr:hypothetical protein ZHAS_00017207 [Anopheles sinensis]